MTVEEIRQHANHLLGRAATGLQRFRRTPRESRDPRTVFVLLGGGSRGAAQAGALTELLEAGIVPDAIVGISAGSWNGAYLGVEPTVERARQLEALWLATSSHDIIGRPRWISALSLLARRRSLFDGQGMRRVAARYLTGLDFADLRLPVRIVAADIISGRAHFFSEGSVLEAVMASSAVPGVFPPIPGGDKLLVDGGMAEWAGCQAALDLGATRICLLACGAPEPTTLKLSGFIQMIQRSMDLAYRDGFNRSIFALRAVGIEVLPVFPDIPACSFLDFDHAAELVEAGRAAANRALLGTFAPSGLGQGTLTPAPEQPAPLFKPSAPPAPSAHSA